jgi:hypothetical protein
MVALIESCSATCTYTISSSTSTCSICSRSRSRSRSQPCCWCCNLPNVLVLQSTKCIGQFGSIHRT